MNIMKDNKEYSTSSVTVNGHDHYETRRVVASQAIPKKGNLISYERVGNESEAFRIPEYLQSEVTLPQARKIMATLGSGNTLQGMDRMNDMWDEHTSGKSPYASDTDLYEDYREQFNAYNRCYKAMVKSNGSKKFK